MAQAASRPKWSSVTCAIRPSRIRAVRPGTGTIIHLAARTSVLESVQDPERTYRNNVALTAGLLELARQRGVKTFLFASTNAVVGNVGRAVITDKRRCGRSRPTARPRPHRRC